MYLIACAYLAAWLQFLKTTRINFNLAVITADPADGAIFRSGPTHPETVLNSATLDFDAKFAARINVGTSGAASPQCLSQALAALTSPLIADVDAITRKAQALGGRAGRS